MGFSTKSYKVTAADLRTGAGESAHQSNPDLYSPDFAKAKDGKYVALLKFLPNMINPARMIMNKTVTWLGDPSNPSAPKKPIDNPETVGVKENPLTSLRIDLFRTKDDKKKAIAREHLGTSTSYYAFVQIISDEHMPELNNRVMLMRFGEKIFKKIVEEAEDSNPFDLTDGPIFKFVLTKTYTGESKNGQNNYDSCKFITKSGDQPLNLGFRYVYNDNVYIAVPDDPNAEYIENYLNECESKINLADATYTPWDDETTALVEDRCRTIKQYAYPEYFGTPQGAIGVGNAVPTYQAPATPQFIPTMAAAPQPAARVSQPTVQPVVPQAPVSAAPQMSAPVISSPAAAPKIPVSVGVETQASESVVPGASASGFDTSDLFDNI